MSNQPAMPDRAAGATHFLAQAPAAQTILPTVSGTSLSGTSLSATTGTGLSTTTVGGVQVPD